MLFYSKSCFFDIGPKIMEKTLRTLHHQLDNFVVTDGTVSCHNDDLQCHQLQQHCQNNNIYFRSMNNFYRHPELQWTNLTAKLFCVALCYMALICWQPWLLMTALYWYFEHQWVNCLRYFFVLLDGLCPPFISDYHGGVLMGCYLHQESGNVSHWL